jgi:lysosomal alpha-mannosidase
MTFTGDSILEEPVASNYFPINTWISMKDQDTSKTLVVVTDRSQGGGSIQDDSLELMVHRRLLDDDDFGVQEPLNEIEFNTGLVARGKHYIIFDPVGDQPMVRTRLLANRIFGQPIVTMNNRPDNGGSIAVKPSGSYQLPENVNLLTLAIIPETRQVRVLSF